jgi:hypothetical protein
MSKLIVNTIEDLSASTSIDVTKLQQSLSGASGGRPVVTNVGSFYFDTTLGKPIWWNGSVWKDSSGSTV